MRAFTIALLCLGSLVAAAIAPGRALATVQFEAAAYPVTIEAESAKGVLWLETEAGQVTCSTTFKGQLNAASVEVALSPSYSECTAFGITGATVAPEGCVWKLHPKEIVAEGEFAGELELSCPAGQSLKVTAGNCAVEFNSQMGLKTVSLTNNHSGSTGDIDLLPLVSGVTYNVTKDGTLCPFNGTGVKSGGLMTSSKSLTTKGQWGGKPIQVQMGGAESGPTAVFKAGSYPASVHGSGGKGAFKLETEAGAVECAGNAFSGGSLSAASSEISFAYAGLTCSAFGLESATIKPEECRYAIHARHETAADEFSAHLNLVCPTGKSIKITAGTCAVELKSQWMLSTVKIVNDTAASPFPNMTVTPQVTGLIYLVTQDGLGCPFAGTGIKSTGKISATEPLTFTAEKTGISVG